MYKLIKNTVSGFRKKVFVQCSMYILTMGLGIYIPYIEGTIVNSLTYSKKSAMFLSATTALFFLFIFRLIISYFPARMQFFKIYSIEVELIEKIIKKLYEMKTIEFRNFDRVYLHSRISDDVNIVMKFFLINIPIIISDLLSVVAVCLFLFFFDSRILLIILTFLMVFILSYFATRKKVYETSFKVQETTASFFSDRNSLFNRYMSNKMRETLPFYIKKNQVKKRKLLDSTQESFKWNYILSTTKISISMIFQFSLFLVGGYFVTKGEWLIGTFTFVLQYFSILLSGIEGLFSATSDYQVYRVSMDRINRILSLSRENDVGKSLNNIRNITITDFNVYRLNTNELLFKKNISKSFMPGHVYTLSGKNGVGKSTFLHNLLGIYDQYEGYIEINGIDYTKICKSGFRKQNVSMMLQNDIYPEILVSEYLDQIDYTNLKSQLIRNSLIQKIFYGSNFDLDQIQNEKLNNLSGGEMKLVDIFCSLFKKEADLIILDEPFSNLSSKLMPDILDFLKSQFFEEKIILIISHDAHTLNQTDVLKVE